MRGPLRTVGVVGVVVIASIGCSGNGDTGDGGDGGGGSASTTAASERTTTTDAATTITSTPIAAASTTPPTETPGATTEAPGVSTPATAVPPPIAAPDDPMPEGRSFGFVTGVNVEGRVLTVDVAQLLTGDAAVAAAVADGAVPADAIAVENDSYVRNRNPLERSVGVAPAAIVRTLKDVGGSAVHETSLADLAVHVALHRAFGQTGGPAWVTVTGGVVTRVEEVYFP